MGHVPFERERYGGASSLRDEIRPRGVDRALEEPELDRALDRVTARRDAELAIDRDRLALDGVARDEQPGRDLREHEMRGQVGEQPQLGPRQAHRPGTGRPGGGGHALVQLPRVLDERPHVAGGARARARSR